MSTSAHYNLVQVYDTIVSLSDDPSARDAYLASVYEEYFQGFGDNEIKMRQFQWRIEGELHSVKSPTERYNRLVAMMWDSVSELSRALNGNR